VFTPRWGRATVSLRLRPDRYWAISAMKAATLIAGGLIGAAAIVVALIGGVVLAAPAQAYPAMPQGVQGPFTVAKVVDGDTIWVDHSGQREKIRMIGMDTPRRWIRESRCSASV
jgi:endonuclease YncB( thermonuclease family)